MDHRAKPFASVLHVLRLDRYLIAVLGDTACCFWGDVLGDGHGLHGLQWGWIRSGEAAACALIDGTIPGENTVPPQCALLTTPWEKMMQKWERVAQLVDCQRLLWQWRCESNTCYWSCCEPFQRPDEKFLVLHLHSVYMLQWYVFNSYCLISHCWGMNQLQREVLITEELSILLTSPSPLWSPDKSDTKENGESKICRINTRVCHKYYHLEWKLSLHCASASILPVCHIFIPASLILWPLPGLNGTYQPYRRSHRLPAS